MRSIVLLLLAASTVFAADDGWKKLSDLKTGTELKIYERGSSQPRLARFSDATADPRRSNSPSAPSAAP